MDDLNLFYKYLEKIKKICSKKLRFENWSDIKLANCDGRLPYWKKCKRGIYFFFDENEKRFDSDNLRVVRVGTHAIKKSIGKSTLWGRLKQHKGNNNMGGNHRGSVFRKLVGETMIKRDGLDYPTWGVGTSANAEIRFGERDIEEKDSRYIRNLPFLVLRVDPESDNNKHISNNGNDRKYLENNIIVLLSDRKNPDKPSKNWLGRSSRRCQIRESGLWQINGIEGPYDVSFFKVFEHYINAMEA
ncbi:MAG: hypothetical protein J7K40_03535 [candidate division Zixibacteria bacterium]|nr:hypothetical protein [candidate division Zixibacteria bacterium]